MSDTKEEEKAGPGGVTILRAIQAKHFRGPGLKKHFAIEDGDPIPAPVEVGTIMGNMTGWNEKEIEDRKTGELRKSLILTGTFEANTADGSVYTAPGIYIPGSAFSELARSEFEKAKADNPSFSGLSMALSVRAIYANSAVGYTWEIKSHVAQVHDPLAEMRKALRKAGQPVRMLDAPAARAVEDQSAPELPHVGDGTTEAPAREKGGRRAA